MLFVYQVRPVLVYAKARTPFLMVLVATAIVMHHALQTMTVVPTTNQSVAVRLAHQIVRESSVVTMDVAVHVALAKATSPVTLTPSVRVVQPLPQVRMLFHPQTPLQTLLPMLVPRVRIPLHQQQVVAMVARRVLVDVLHKRLHTHHGHWFYFAPLSL
jgi:hypothetical protein